MLRRARGLRESDATVTCVPVNLRTKNETIILILSFFLSARGQAQSRDRSRKAHGLRTRNSLAVYEVIRIDCRGNYRLALLLAQTRVS